VLVSWKTCLEVEVYSGFVLGGTKSHKIHEVHKSENILST